MFKLQIDVIKNYIEKYPKSGARELARLIMKEEEVETTDESKYINTLRARIEYTRKIEKEAKSEETKPKVKKERYIWKTIYGQIDIPVSEIDELFYQYSKHGLNMSQTAIINKHNLEAWQWQSIKRKLQLVKDANIFSPYTVNKYEGPKLEEMINELIGRRYKNKGLLVEEAYHKQTLKAYKKVIDEDEKFIHSKDVFYNEVLRMMPKADFKNTLPITKGKVVNGEVVITIADLHNGARIENIQNTLDFNPRILEGYLDQMAEEINQQNYKAVNLAFLGDLIESFTGLNHKNSWKGIEFGYYGSTVVIKTVELISRFISKVNNVKRLIGVNGNHDRSTSDNKEDTRGEIGTLIFYMLKQMYVDKIEILHHEDCVSIKIDGIQYIITHGHLPEMKKGSDKIINRYGNSQLFNLILTGHLHSRIISDDDENYRHIWCPSLFTGNRFSKQLGFSSTAGYLRITNNGKDRPNVNDITL